MILSVTLFRLRSRSFCPVRWRKRESRRDMGQESLRPTCRHHAQGLTITLAVVIVVLSGLLTTRMGSEFMPSLNEGDIALHAIRIVGTSLTTSIEMQNEVEKKDQGFPEVDKTFSKVGVAQIATTPCRPVWRTSSSFLSPNRNGQGRTVPRRNW